MNQSPTVRRFGRVPFGPGHARCPLHGIAYPVGPGPAFARPPEPDPGTRAGEDFWARRVRLAAEQCAGILEAAPGGPSRFAPAFPRPALGWCPTAAGATWLLRRRAWYDLRRGPLPAGYGVAFWGTLDRLTNPDALVALAPADGCVLVAHRPRGVAEPPPDPLAAAFTAEGLVDYFEAQGFALARADVCPGDDPVFVFRRGDLSVPIPALD